jgi:hypothetical protein
LLNRGEIYRMVIEICKKLCTLCPLYRPDQGNIVGRVYIHFYKFLLPYGISLSDSTIGFSSYPHHFNHKSEKPSIPEYTGFGIDNSIPIWKH